MLKNLSHPDPQNVLFTGLLIFSIALHALILSQLEWKIRIPEKSEVVFEVELVKPVKKIVPAKPKPRPFSLDIKPKPRPVVTPEKPMLLEKKQSPKPATTKPEVTIRSAPKPVDKPVPVKPVLKPMLNIVSDVEQSVVLTKSDLPVGNQKPQAPSSEPLIVPIDTPENRAEATEVLPDRKTLSPSLSFDPEDLKRVPSREVLDSGQIAEPNRESDIKSDIRSQKETVRYRVIEQTGQGESRTPGTGEEGDNMIEGELRQRKVIYKPDPPSLNLERDVTVTLKFTVLPNGEVDRIFPYRKAEPELERLAMKLLRQYRFEPLFENDKIQEGIIHFSIYRSH